jgi:nitrite reductase/ring-hydroxylating ferredoxin subunit
VAGLDPTASDAQEDPMADLETTTSDPRTRTAAGAGSADLPRRTMLKGLAIAGAAVPFLAGCGSSGGSGDSSGHESSTPTHPGSVGAAGDGSTVITPVAAVHVGGGVILPDKGIVVTQPTKGTFEGFSSTCTHAGCTVGTITGGKIICPCHGSQYSITDGSVVGGTAPRPLPKKPVKVDGSNIVSA